MSETFCPPGFGVDITVQVVAAAAGEAIRARAVATAIRVPGSHRLVMCALRPGRRRGGSSACTTTRDAPWLYGRNVGSSPSTTPSSEPCLEKALGDPAPRPLTGHEPAQLLTDLVALLRRECEETVDALGDPARGTGARVEGEQARTPDRLLESCRRLGQAGMLRHEGQGARCCTLGGHHAEGFPQDRRNDEHIHGGQRAWGEAVVEPAREGHRRGVCWALEVGLG